MNSYLKPLFVFGVLVYGFVACSNDSADAKPEEEVSSSAEITHQDLSETSVEIEDEPEQFGEEPEQFEEVFAIRYLDAEKNPISEFRLDEKIFVDITYPAGFVRSTFNLYEFSLMIADRNMSFASLMIPYAEFVEREDGISLAFMLESGEEMDMNIKFHEKYLDDQGRLKFYGTVADNSLYLQSTSDTLALIVE